MAVTKHSELLKWVWWQNTTVSGPSRTTVVKRNADKEANLQRLGFVISSDALLNPSLHAVAGALNLACLCKCQKVGAWSLKRRDSSILSVSSLHSASLRFQTDASSVV